MALDVVKHRKQQEKIKNRLCNIQFDQPHTSNLNYPSYFNLVTQRLKKQNSDYRQLSDWTSNHELPQPNITQRHRVFNTEEQKDPRRKTFFNTKRYPSSLLHQDNKESRLELSPVVVRFNARMLNENLQKSKEKYMKRLKEDPYITHYQSSSLVKNVRSKTKNEKMRTPQFKEIKFDCNPEDQKKMRMTGILKLIKKQVPFRSRPHKPINPQFFNSTTRMF